MCTNGSPAGKSYIKRRMMSSRDSGNENEDTGGKLSGEMICMKERL